MSVAAISTGIVDGEARLDLPYVEDSQAEVDCNFVMTGDGRFVEVQATAEKDAVLGRAIRGAGRAGRRRGCRRCSPASARRWTGPRR